jgi:hypothetical protein
MTKLLLIVGIAGFFALMCGAVGPIFVPGILTVAQPLLCPDGQITSQNESRTDNSGTMTTYYARCVSSTGEVRPLDQFQTLAATTGLLCIPMIIIVGIPLALLMRPAKVEDALGAGVFGSGQIQPNPALQRQPGSMPDANQTNLNAKLKQLEEAYRAGLITDAEYNQRRKEILDHFTQ